MPGYEQSTRVAVGQFELWFASVATPRPDPNSSTGELLLHIMNEDGTLIGAWVNVRIVNSSSQLVKDAPVVDSGYGANTHLEEGIYRVFVDLQGYETAPRTVSIKSGQETTATFKLKKKGRPTPEQGPPDLWKPSEQIKKYTKP